MSNGFLPVCKQDMKELNIEQLDFVLVSGDAYVDHASFAHAIISRVLQAHGYSVGLICQPNFHDEESITILGKPRLGFLVSAGNMDSMVNHYTVSKKRRGSDAYSPGGEMGLRPDNATIVYCNMIRKMYKDSPIIIGGIEASLRRLGHYDYWSNKVKRSILLDSGADIITYGMGEHSIVEVADALESGIDVRDITFIRGTIYKTRDEAFLEDGIRLPDYEDIRSDKREYARSYGIQEQNTDPFVGKKLYETYDNVLYVVQNPPSKPLSQQELDDVYELPFMNTYHPMYKKAGGVPAIEEIKFSLTSARGCFGGCSFCALTFHQGRIIQARSHESIIREAKAMTKMEDFKGYIHDVGGPTANFRHKACDKQETKGACPNRQCLFPKPCKNLNVDHKDYIKLLRSLRKIDGVKKVFIRSGIRYDYVLADSNNEFLEEICKHHISGQLRVAPEHISNNVLDKMGKPSVQVYNKFIDRFNKTNKRLGIEQYAVPYLMSSHPGSTLEDAIELAEFIHEFGFMPKQVQDFYPTPSTVSTCMYYTGYDPRDMSEVYVERNPHRKAMQRALIQYREPKNYDLVKEALLICGRDDLIGLDEHCLIPPRKGMKLYGPRKNDVKDTKNTDKGNVDKSRKNNSYKRNVEKQGKNISNKNRSNKPDKDNRNPKSGEAKSRKRKPIRNIHKKKNK